MQNISKIRSIPGSGREIVNFDFCKSDYKSFNFVLFSCSFEDGHVIYGKSIETEFVASVKIALKDSKPPRLVYKHMIKKQILYIDKSTGHLVIVYEEQLTDDKKGSFFVSEVVGNFDDAVFCSDRKFASVSLGTVTFYIIAYPNKKRLNNDLWKLDEFELNLIRSSEIDAHFSEITFMFNKGIFKFC